jgi:hypothetical protein
MSSGLFDVSGICTVSVVRMIDIIIIVAFVVFHFLSVVGTVEPNP